MRYAEDEHPLGYKVRLCLVGTTYRSVVAALDLLGRQVSQAL